MASDEAILRQRRMGASPSTLRLYSWLKPTVSLGYFQHIGVPLAALCRQQHLALVRRPTGGGFVLHDQEITFSVIFSRQDLRPQRQTVEYYRVIATCVQKALWRLNIAVTLAEKVFDGRDNSFLCFNKPTKYDLLVAGKKVCGSAQRRYGEIILQQGSLILRTSGDPGFWRQAAGVEEVLCEKISRPEIYQALQTSFAEELRIAFVPGGLTAAERALARRLTTEKYTQVSWNYQGQYQGEHD
ncbi:MAG: lipoate--protein ligase family protein [Elusimicrobia bacterium]|nr:lipoate--protein ligase family protein [Elusimicrobiota bacterium]